MSQDNVQEYFQSWLCSTPEFVFFKDLDGIYREISESILDLVNLDYKEQMLGKSDMDVYSQELAMHFMEEDRIVKETNANYLCEDWVNHRTLGKILIETLKAPMYNTEGKIIGIQGIARNITEKYKLGKEIKQKESELRAIFKTLPSMIWIKDLQGRYLHTNESYQQFFGVNPREISGEKVYNVLYKNDLIAPENLKELKRLDDEVTNKKETISIVIPVTTNAGERWIEIIKSPIILDDGTMCGIFGACEDITERKNYDCIMKIAKDKAEEASRMKSDFLANISHEIRTPMNGIMGFIQLLESTNLDEEQKDYVAEISKSSQLLLSLLNDLLDLAKAESGKLILENTSFCLYDIMDDAAALALSYVREKPIEIFSYIDTRINKHLIGDPCKLKQVLNNFISNAVKFTEKGQIYVMAHFVSKADDEIEVLFKIEDTGIGIKKENLDKIFESFTQADASTTRKYGGTGLGLSIAKNIVQKMNGKIRVESDYGVGSAFSFTAKFKIDKDFPLSPEYDFSNKNVVVLNNNPFTSSSLRKYFENLNVNFVEANSSKIALKYVCSSEKTDLIVTTFYKNDNESKSFLQELRELSEGKDIPVVIIASRFEKENLLSVKDANLKIIYRPAKIRELESSINAILEK